MNCCNCYGCFLKTNAFIVALLSIAVLTFSTIVLISAVSYDPAKHLNNTDEAVSYPPLESGQDDQDNGNIPNDNVTNPGHNQTNGPNSETNVLYLIDDSSSNSNNTVDFPVSGDKEEDYSTSLSSPSQPVPSGPTSLNLNLTYDNTGEGADGIPRSNQMSTTESPSTTSHQPKEEDAFFDKHFNFWKGKSDTYIHLMQGSSGTGIFAGFLQLVFSWFLICGSTKDLKERTKLWNLSNLIVLILLVVIILVPLSYNTSTNTFKGGKVFLKEIYRRIKSLEGFSVETLEIMWSSVSNFSGEDLTLFYYVLGADALILFGFLVPPFLCCLFYPCRRCCCKKKSTRTDSDLMLFGTNEPF